MIGTCHHDNQTTVYAHVGRNRGTAIKCGDNMGVYACNHCHDAIDGRTKYDEQLNPNIYEDIFRALEETQGKLIDKGLMTIP